MLTVAVEFPKRREESRSVPRLPIRERRRYSRSDVAVTVRGACSGTLSGTALCGDATGSVAHALQTTAGADSTFSLIMLIENDPIGTGPQPASPFVEVQGPEGFSR